MLVEVEVGSKRLGSLKSLEVKAMVPWFSINGLN